VSPDHHKPQDHRLTFVVLAVAGTAYAVMSGIVAPALPDIQEAMGTGSTGGGWVLTAFLLSTAVATPIVGRIGDMFGKERVLLGVLTAMVMGSALCGVAGSLLVLITGRVLQGIGGAVFPLAFGIIRDEFPVARRPGGIALMSSLLGIGGGAGVIMTGPIVEHLGLSWIFWIPLILAAVALVATALFVPESPVKVPGRVNVRSALLFSGWLVFLLVAVSEGPDWGWTSVRVIGLLVLAALTVAAWVRFEERSPQPLVDMHMMRLRGVWTVNLVALLLGAGMYSSFILIPTLVQEPTSSGYGFGASITEAGLYMAPSAFVMLLASPLAGRLAKRFGSRLPLVLGAAMTTAAFVLLAAEHGQKASVFVGTTVLGFGVGLAFASLANLIVDAVPPHQTGVATGINTMVRTVGGAIGSTVAAVMLAAGTVAAVPPSTAFTNTFLAAAGAQVLALLAALLIPRARSAYNDIEARPGPRSLSAATVLPSERP
jgi:EmrB/QacA subfamily drug resistance transporter